MKKKPKRSRTERHYVDGDLGVSRCPSCGSTDRSKYFRKASYALPANWFHDGRPATHVVYRFCRCKCGQWRRDRSFENRVKPQAEYFPGLSAWALSGIRIVVSRCIQLSHG